MGDLKVEFDTRDGDGDKEIVVGVLKAEEGVYFSVHNNGDGDDSVKKPLASLDEALCNFDVLFRLDF